MLKALLNLMISTILPYTYLIVFNETSSALFNLDVQRCGQEKIFKFMANLSINENSKIQEWPMKKQLSNCPLYVIWAIMPPFVDVNNETLLPEGIFIDFLNAFASISQRKIVYRPFDMIYLDEISMGYNFESVLTDFQTGYAEMFIGPVNLQTASIFHISPILMENPLLFLSPKPLASLFTSLSSILFVIYWPVFNLFLSLTLYFISKFGKDRFLFSSIMDNFLLLMGFCLGISCLQISPTTFVIRFFLSMLLIQFLIITLYIQGSVVSEYSSTIYGKSIQSIDDLLDSNLPIKIVSGASILFKFSRLHERDNEVYQRIEIFPGAEYPFQVFNEVVIQKNFTTLIDRGYLMMRPNILKSFSVFTVFNLKPVIAMSKNRFSGDKHNEYFQTLIEIGIIEKYNSLCENHYAQKYFVIEDRRSFVLTLYQLFHFLILIVILYILSIIIFIFEIIVSKCCKSKY
ncbi:hypothetical protein ABEB36_008062 [Hypothenemus hampei]|uniref:Ionotropic receptor n=1 Tax=Hypothenemus hampei TaxID=57062 RepID=A0ABD1EKK8_HYPHA